MDEKEAMYTLSGLFSDAIDDWKERGGSLEELIDAILSLTENKTVRDKVIEILLKEIDISMHTDGLQKIQVRIVDDSALWGL